MTDLQITETIARKVLDIVDAGLVKGVGRPQPGAMCVEAAVCYAMGLPHGDDPSCVSRALRNLKIKLNDSSWSSNHARAKGLRRLAVAQLGSRNHLDDVEFTKRIAKLAISTCVPNALRVAASIHKDAKHRAALLSAAARCEREQSREAASDARATARAAAAAAADAAAYAAAAAAYAAARAADAADAKTSIRDRLIALMDECLAITEPQPVVAEGHVS